MKKIILFILFSTIIAGAMLVTGCSATGNASDKLIVAMELAYPPFETKDDAGKPSGVSVDFSELKYEGMGFIIATHEMGFALHACEKVAFLCDGNIVEYGNSSTVFSSPKTDELKKFLSKLLAWSV